MFQKQGSPLTLFDKLSAHSALLKRLTSQWLCNTFHSKTSKRSLLLHWTPSSLRPANAMDGPSKSTSSSLSAKAEDREQASSEAAVDGCDLSGQQSEADPALPLTNKKGQVLSNRALKRLSRSQKYKELKKQKRAESLRLAQNDSAGYKDDDFDQSSYIIENGLRKVLPYNYVFSTYAKGRWVGRRLYEVLAREFGYDHPDQLGDGFKLGKILVNHNKVSSDYVVKDCDYITHRIHRHENPVTAAPIEVLADTEDLVVVNKPSSIPCHPCGRYRFNSMVFILGKEMGFSNLRNIYRLDRLTSGVLVMGKTTHHTKLLEDQIANRQVQKEYVCRVVGKFPEGRVEVDQPLTALSNKLRLQVVSTSGKASRTTFERVSYNGISSVVRCWPQTGRTHQIRVHLQYLGHPIINDGFYNNLAWGPGIGKGGDYEVPFPQVCERILQEHNVNLWDGGENPLYFEKLRACSERNGQQRVMDDTPAGKETKPIDTDTVPVVDSEDEPPSKRMKTKDSLNEDNPKLCDRPSPSPADSSPHPGNQEQDKEAEVSHTNVTGRANPEAFSGSRDSERVEKTSDSDALSGPGASSALYETIDLNCEMCKKLPVDPQAKHLVMFLHALKYKGPGWEYEAPWPDWAEPEWNKEQDFML